jgi:hypothetical protein
MKTFTFVRIPFIGLIFFACSPREKKPVDNSDTTNIVQKNDTIVIGNDTLGTNQVEETTMETHWNNPDDDIPYETTKKIDKLVNEMAAKLKQRADYEFDYADDYLDEKTLGKLNTKELIYYCLTYPASFSQICAADEFEDSTGTPKILSYLVNGYSAFDLSKIQVDALYNKRDSIILFIDKLMQLHGEKTDRYYFTILHDLNAIESIPRLVKIASAQCIDAFTVLVLFMHEASYEPFIQSEINTLMFGDNSYAYGQRVEASKANMHILKETAINFYKEKK